MKKILVPAALLLVIACSPKLIMPAQTDVDRVSDRYPDYTLGELNKGMSLYKQYCGTCHELKMPNSKTPEEWEHIVPEMTKKANKRTMTINAEAQESILRYLVTMSQH